jgi:hypothetical protein
MNKSYEAADKTVSPTSRLGFLPKFSDVFGAKTDSSSRDRIISSRILFRIQRKDWPAYGNGALL